MRSASSRTNVASTPARNSAETWKHVPAPSARSCFTTRSSGSAGKTPSKMMRRLGSREAFQRVPQVTEDREEIRRRNVLVDGDEEGYLLQIFTRNLIGPIFIEIIQRKNHLSFGEGNFSALFRSIEREQARRGVFDEPRR
jgi:hypothetical protein